MKGHLLDIFGLLLATILVVAIFALYVDPIVAEMQRAVDAEPGSMLPRNIFVIVKDTEQKICLILLLWGIFLIGKEFLQIDSYEYLFDVDLFSESDVTSESSMVLLEEMDSLPSEVKNAPLVEVVSSVLRRFALTADVHSSTASIEPALDSLSIRNESRLTLVRYIVWAVPSIGFVGTVRGIGQAMAQAEVAVAGNIGPMTSSLGVAFNSTLVALLISIILMLAASIVQRRQDDQIVQIQEYVENYLIKRVIKK